jgi:hypothetical protein
MSNPLDATQFTLESAERIARVVRAAELGSPQARALTFDRVDAQRKDKVFRVCTFTGAWSIGSAKTVTFQNVTSTPNTVSAVNLFFPIGTAQTSTLTCAVAKDGTAWYLVDVPMQTATAIFIKSTQSAIVVTGTATGVAVTSTARGISVGSTATLSYVTDVSISASLNTSSCSITIGKTLTSGSATFVTGTATATFVSGTSTALFVTGTATTVQVTDTYTGTYLRFGY